MHHHQPLVQILPKSMLTLNRRWRILVEVLQRLSQPYNHSVLCVVA